MSERRDRSLGSMLSVIEAPSAGPPPRTSDRPIVLYRTPWQRPADGWSIAARANARAMAMGGLDVRLVAPIEEGTEIDPLVLEEVRPFLKRTSDWDLHVFSSPLNSAKIMAPMLSDMQLQRGPQVMHCMFERQFLEPELVQQLNKVTTTWAQCSANRDVLKQAGVLRVDWIEYPYFDDDPHLKLPPPVECRRMLWVGRFEPRKAPDQLLRAFLRAFRPGEATLTLKVSPHVHSGHYYHSPEEVLLYELCEPDVIKRGWDATRACAAVRVIRGKLTWAEMVQLNRSHDVYVSASRGEGLDLPAFAAKLAGRKLVTTDSGGPRDFLNDGDVLVPASGVIPADKSYYWGEGATYSDYRLDDLVAALQSVRSSPPRGSRVPANFRAENVGKKFREWAGNLTGR